ncbi:DUF397 domain-containing protein [Streptomyces pratensis]|uniref:DUF397 domain-containing protein n=1 Tax=Streptomyces pratensis TaxID=1169025 RepID=UPI001932267F|nr:DUF397 domain-containing protein [Streptomyces pratensis]
MSAFQFAKSSYSTKEHDCVEVARNMPRVVAVRDSKQLDSPVLTVAPSAWAAFTADLRRQP